MRVVLFLIPCKVDLAFAPVDEMVNLQWSHSGESLFTVLSGAALSLCFQSVNEMQRFDHSNEAFEECYWVVLFIMLQKVVLRRLWMNRRIPEV